MMNTGCKLILIVLTLFSIPCGYAAEKPLQAGYGEFNITPKLGTTMPGYFSERRADGILDPLLAKVLLLRHENTEIAIIAADLIGIPKPVVDKIRQEITQKTKIPTDHIFIHATHTHTGATVSEIADALPNQFTKAVQRAQQNTQKTPSISYGCGEDHSVAFIRRFLMKNGTVRTNPGRQNPEVVKPIGSIDPRVHVITLQEAKTLLVSFGLHLDCVGGTKFSADYPYHMTQSIKKHMGDEWNVLFLNACCGNVNHIDVNNPKRFKGNTAAETIGKSIAEKVINACNDSKPVSLLPLAAKTRTVMCKYRPVPKDLVAWARNEMNNDAKQASKRQFNEYTPSRILALAEKQGKAEPAEIIALRLGEVGIAGLPAEVFVEIGRDIQTHSLLSPTLAIGLTGGSMGYMPHRRGYHESGYESTYGSARYAEETPLKWAMEASRLLNDIVIHYQK